MSNTIRTLAKPNKPKQQQPQAEGQKKENKQQPSKKITKTVFHSPFRYKMCSFPYADRPSTSKMLISCSASSLTTLKALGQSSAARSSRSKTKNSSVSPPR